MIPPVIKTDLVIILITIDNSVAMTIAFAIKKVGTHDTQGQKINASNSKALKDNKLKP